VNEIAQIRVPVSAGSSVQITLDNNNGLAQNDYVLIGEMGGTQTEIAKINAAVSAGQVIQVDTLVFPHGEGTKIYLLKYNQIKFYRAATIAGAKTLLTTKAIDADNIFTEYQDTVNSTGYAFFTLYNSTTADESGYSGAYPYTLLKSSTRAKIRALMQSFYGRAYEEETFQALCDAAEAEVFAIKRWRFREAYTTFTTTNAQQAYSLATLGITDFGQLVYATYNGDPIIPIRIKTHKLLNWSTIVTTTPRAIWEWAGSLYLTPIPDGAKTVELYYYKNSSGFDDETSETAIQLPIAIAARVAQWMWIIENPKKAAEYEKMYLQTISAMKINDKKEVSVFPALTDNRLSKMSVFDQFDNPSIDIP
jgi:hypothetical protein